MFKCGENTIVYVVCPAHGKTGGLELLHQLVYKLNRNGVQSYIVYTNIRSDSPVINPAFERYVNSYKTFSEIEDTPKNIVVISEHRIELIDKIRNAKVAIWWLSVDNYLKVYDHKTAYRYLKFKGVAWYIKNRRWRYSVERIKNRIEYNLAQSYYAIDFLNQNGFKNIAYLSDYISLDYLDVKLEGNEQRNNVVLYNPKKGKEFTDYLMSLAPDIQWIPLIGMTNAQVREYLLHSKVYIDFGNHPGKDRFPREAAYCGCCVITGQRGSANYYDDVPIPSDYKFMDDRKLGNNIIKMIRECFAEYEKRSKDFSAYRDMILHEYEKFTIDVHNVFCE